MAARHPPSDKAGKGWQIADSKRTAFSPEGAIKKRTHSGLFFAHGSEVKDGLKRSHFPSPDPGAPTDMIGRNFVICDPLQVARAPLAKGHLLQMTFCNPLRMTFCKCHGSSPRRASAGCHDPCSDPCKYGDAKGDHDHDQIWSLAGGESRENQRLMPARPFATC